MRAATPPVNPLAWLQQTLAQWPKPAWPNLPAPPAWAVDELRQRIVLLLNHVLQQEPQATERLARQKERQVRVQWRSLSFQVRITPAGLLDVVAPSDPADLLLTLTDETPLALARQVATGEKPGVRIEGDVQLAAEVNWITEHVRWDLEEDLARLIGDVPAHTLAQAAGRAVAALRTAAQRASAWVPGAAAR